MDKAAFAGAIVMILGDTEMEEKTQEAPIMDKAAFAGAIVMILFIIALVIGVIT
jgi:hypothetical protein